MLDVRGLTHRYPGGVTALDGVSLQAPPGMFGLLGPNGAGKSSLMRCLATLQVPSEGEIRFGDIDVRKEPERLRKVLGYLPQDFGVYPRVSAIDMLDQMAVLKGVSNAKQRREVVEGLLNQVNLWSARKKPLASFSGGMRQRFGIAQALIGDPKLVIVDEPTAGLDPEERNRFLNLLADIGEDVLVILSTHIVDDVADLCPRMAVLAQGRIILQGAPHDLVAQLSGRIWRRIVSKAEAEEIRSGMTVISTRLMGGRTMVHVLSDSTPGPGFEPAPGGLEDVYFSALSAARAA
ncbi:MAG: ABC transporter ATP-binding protein [Alphaproteobacteria bacterium]|nr:ABC transporter ATP-binding protein [Alphaproteobacteria bacterium]